MRLAATLAIAATPALAQAEKVWPGTVASDGVPSTAILGAPQTSGASATLTFANTRAHFWDEEFSLTFNGITVSVSLDYQFEGSHAEAITVIAPPGYIAIPDLLVVDEGHTGEVHVFKWLGG